MIGSSPPTRSGRNIKNPSGKAWATGVINGGGAGKWGEKKEEEREGKGCDDVCLGKRASDMFRVW